MSSSHQALMGGGGRKLLLVGDVTIGLYLTQWYGYVFAYTGSWNETIDNVGVLLTAAVSRNIVQEAWIKTNQPLLTTTAGASTPTVDVINRGLPITMAPTWEYDDELGEYVWSGYFNYTVGSTDPWGWASKSGQTETIEVYATAG